VARTRTRSLDEKDETLEQQQNDATVSDSRRRRRQRRDVQPEETTDSTVSTRKDRPTPSARKVKPRGKGSTGLINRIWGVRHLVAYFRGVSAELQKVTWPTREETTRLTGIVLAVTAAFAMALGLLDAFYSWWFRRAFHGEDTMFLIVAGILAILVGGTYTLFRNRI
jgi:preprotein translocase SecE subunit